MQEKAGLTETLELMRDLRRRCEWDATRFRVARCNSRG